MIYSGQGFSGQTAEFAPSAHLDSFPRDNLPPRDQWPELIFELPELRYPLRLNCATELLDRNLPGRADHPAVVTPAETLTYAQLAERVNRIANVLTGRMGMVPGNRVLLLSANNAWMVAAYFAVLKAGGVVVASMPLLRAKEISQMLAKAEITHALADARLRAEMVKAEPAPAHLAFWGEGELEAMCAEASPDFTACDTAADDVCLLGFTSGTTGVPKATMHFHRDMMAICDAYGMQVLKPQPDDIFIGSPPLAFTFGLGGLVLFPFRVGATAVLLEKASPDDLLPAIAQYKATVTFTAPTAYRVMAAKGTPEQFATLRKGVSAGETLPVPIFEAWKAATGLELMDGIGGTEMLHIFIGAPEGRIRAGATGIPVPGYRAKVIDENGAEVPRGTPGRLAVQGPTGCRYLADDRQKNYVQNGWNLPGDTYIQDEDGYFLYQARSDDMIISSGYNIAGPEVEAALLAHPAVRECAVVGTPDSERGMLVTAHVVLHAGHAAEPATARLLQDHVKAAIAPYKYPRLVQFADSLPRTESGKLQRFVLRQQKS
ncbi:2-aminobenzoate-CoA ligase [Rhodovarius crocodyli]|uniref:2-aminobenzoate-CoA ligase n=1 Tax=Rhodovarius crocodyli TaxID=1979269 RepID=A0A437M1C3_9PROT|nr:AMP-binding protein [Rhodovarius crocodyli]RVT91478.1 2-aminobenzoate-CoA ligase [Rhodovarius crocodyli]